MLSSCALIAIIVALLVSLVGALDIRGRLKTDLGRRRLKYVLLVAALSIAGLQLFLQSHSARRVTQLEAAIGVRTIAPAQRNELVSALKAFAGQKYWIMVQGTELHGEQGRFAEQLDEVLSAAGWLKSQNVTMRDSATGSFRERPLPFLEHTTETGVVVFGPADNPKAAAALQEQLGRLGIRVELARAADLKDSVIVDVGPR